MMLYAMFISLLHIVTLITLTGGQLRVIYEWKTPDFTWSSNDAKSTAIQNGQYVPANVVILDVDCWEPNPSYGQEEYKGPNSYSGYSQKRFFVTSPKFKSGVPATLSTISSKMAQDGSLLLEPFPDWETHREGNCDGLTSVFRVQIDECGKLWVLDTGKVFDTNTNRFREVCKPQIVVYDLKNNNNIVARHRFPDSVLECDSLLITIVVDTRDAQCQEQYAYVADVIGYKMLIYDAQTKQSWRASSNYFHPFPDHGMFTVNGIQFDMMDGIFGLALGPLANNDRKVYFHAAASVKECWTMASILLNRTNFDNNATPTKLFQISEGERSSQCTVEVMSNEGILFYPQISSNSLQCWNSKTVFRQENFVTIYKNDETYQFNSGIKLKNNRNLYACTSTLQYLLAGQPTDTSQVNYRILTGTTEELTRNTQCAVRG